MRALQIVRKDLRQVFADKKVLLFMIVMPIAFTAGLGFALADVGKTPAVAVQVLGSGDGGVVEKALLDALHARRELTLSTAPHTREGERAARELVARQKLAAVVLIPAGLDARAASGPLPRLDVVADPADADARVALAVLAESLAQLDGAAFAARALLQDPNERAASDATPPRDGRFAGAFATALAAAAALPVTPLEVLPLRSPGATAMPSGFGQASPGLLVQFGIMSLLFCAGVVFAERRAGVWRRLLAAPVRTIDIVLGHGLAMFLVIVLQSTILVVVGVLAFDVAYDASPTGVAIIGVSLAAWVTGLGLTIAVLARREEHVTLLALLAMFFFTGLGGAWVPLEVTSPAVAGFGGLLPSGLAMKGLQDIILRGQGVSSTLGPALGIAAWTVAFYALAGVLLRRS